MGDIGQDRDRPEGHRPESLRIGRSAADGDPQLADALDRMEMRFGNLMSQITLIFNVMIRFMKDGNVAQFRAAKAAMLEMSLSLREAHEVAVEHLRSLPIP